MSQIRSALSPKYGDEWDRIFGAPTIPKDSDAIPAIHADIGSVEFSVRAEYDKDGNVVNFECKQFDPGTQLPAGEYEYWR
jgi:hypothetical protein